MSANRLLVILSAAALSACCSTVIIKPSKAPVCIAPETERDACNATATLADNLTYGDLPELVRKTRQDFIECRQAFTLELHAYQACIADLQRFNRALARLENESREKYKGATLVEDGADDRP